MTESQLITTTDKKNREFASNTRPGNVNIKKKRTAFKIVHCYFSKEEKWSLIL